MKRTDPLWLLPLLIGLVYHCYSSYRCKKRIESLFAGNGVDQPDLATLNASLDRFNQEHPEFFFFAKQRLNIVVRGQLITLARGSIGSSTCASRGSCWSAGDGVFVVCPLAAESWGRNQKDMLKKAATGSELIVYWVRNIHRVADEMMVSPKSVTADSCPEDGSLGK